MKIMLFNKAYKRYVNPFNPCKKCILKGIETCSEIPVAVCEDYGGFQSSDTKIFTV